MKNLLEIMSIVFGIILLIVSFVFNEFEYMTSDLTASWDRLIITGYCSCMFILTYGLGLSLFFYGYYNLKINKLKEVSK